jgi:hypothetical protein
MLQRTRALAAAAGMNLSASNSNLLFHHQMIALQAAIRWAF